jgi:hypothetical protein
MSATSAAISLPEWQPVYQLRWYRWFFLMLYSCLVEFTMALVSVSCLGLGVCLLAGWLPPGFDPALAHLKWYEVVFVMAMAAFLGWFAVPRFLAEALDIIAPTLTFEGLLETMEVQHRRTKNSGYKVWQLGAAGQFWEIAFFDVQNRFEFPRQVKAGGQLRVRYRRGTHLVTGLWVLKKGKSTS